MIARRAASVLSPPLLRIGVLTAAVLALTASQSSASFTITLNKEFSNSGTPDYNVAKMTITDVAGGVQVKIETLFTGGEKLTSFYWNLSDSLFPVGATKGSAPISGVTITQESNGQGAVGTPQIQFNNFKADGDGDFDVRVTFPTSGNTFNANEYVSFFMGGVTTDDIKNSISVNGPAGKTGFHVAAHIQSIGAQGGSGWYTGTGGFIPGGQDELVPVPPSLVLVGLGAVCFGGIARLRRRRAAAA
jgi:hypothetical protein